MDKYIKLSSELPIFEPKNRFEDIKQKIEAHLLGSIVKIVDENAFHADHGPTGDHIAITVIWKGFANKPLVEQHKMIYDILKEEVKTSIIHSLKIKTNIQ